MHSTLWTKLGSGYTPTTPNCFGRQPIEARAIAKPYARELRFQSLVPETLHKIERSWHPIEGDGHHSNSPTLEMQLLAPRIDKLLCSMIFYSVRVCDRTIIQSMGQGIGFST